MSSISSTHWTLSCWAPEEAEQTGCSIAVRVTAAVLALMAVTIGILNLASVLHMGAAVGWTGVSLGAVLVLISACIQSVKTSALETAPKVSIPQEVIVQFPSYMQEALAGVPYLTDRKDIDALKNRKEPIVAYALENTVGISLRLRVNHIDCKPSYIPRNLLDPEHKAQVSTKQSFTISVIVRTELADNPNQWVLLTRNACIEHRGVPYEAQQIMEHGTYSFRTLEESKENLERFRQTAIEDELVKDEQHLNLHWLLARWFSGQSVKVWEKDINQSYFSLSANPGLGYWEITLEQ